MEKRQKREKSSSSSGGDMFRLEMHLKRAEKGEKHIHRASAFHAFRAVQRAPDGPTIGPWRPE